MIATVDVQGSIEPMGELHCGFGVAALGGSCWQLNRIASKGNGVIVGYRALVAEAETTSQIEATR